MSHVSFFLLSVFCACIRLFNRIYLVYAHFSSYAVVDCRLSGRQIFCPRLVFTVFALLFIHSFPFLLYMHHATLAKGLITLMSFYYDYIRPLCSFYFSRSLLLSSFSFSQYAFTTTIQKKKKAVPERRTNEQTNIESRSVCSSRSTL